MRVSMGLVGIFTCIAACVAAGAISGTPKPPPKICLEIGGECKSTPATPVSASGLKWHPGHYTWLGGRTPNPARLATWNSQIDGLCSDKYIKGVQLYIAWGALESGTAPGNFSAGFAALDQIIAKLASCGKKLMLGINTQEYGGKAAKGAAPDPDGYAWLYPLYLTTQGTFGDGSLHGVIFERDGEWGSVLASTPRFWDPVVMDRLIALVQALGARYDSNPVFEQFYVETISMPRSVLQSDGAGYDAYYAQYKRLLGAASTAWPHTVVRSKADWVDGSTYAVDFISYCLSLPNCGLGQNDPEVPLPNVTGVEKTRNGQLIATIFRGLEGGGADNRGKVAWTGEVQEVGLGAKYTYTPAQLHAFFHDYAHATHELWLYNDYLGGPEQRWSTGIKPFIDSIKGAVYTTACPLRYKSCNTN